MDHPRDECRRTFITWRRVALILVAVGGLIVSYGWKGASWKTEVDYKMADIDTRTMKVELAIRQQDTTHIMLRKILEKVQ